MDNNEGNSEEADFYGGVEHRNGGTDDKMVTLADQ
jgi:hypothetical protein